MLRGVAVGRSDANEIAVTNHFDAGKLFGWAGVDGCDGGVETFRTKHRSEEHAGARDVGGVFVLAGDEVAPIGLGDSSTGDLPVSCGRQRWVAVDFFYEIVAAREFAIGEGTRALRIGDLAVGCCEFGGVDAPALSRHLGEGVAGRYG